MVKYLKKHISRFSMLSAVFVFSLFSMAAAENVFAEVILAEGHEAMMPVFIAEDASGSTEEAAEYLAEYLEKISGAVFEIKRGDGSEGIALGTACELPGLGLEAEFDSDDPFRREEYLIRSRDSGLLLIGATGLGVSNAVWDLLNRFGYRYYFPTDTWEIIPELDKLAITIDTFESPDYYNRRIWWTTDRWDRVNRSQSGFSLSTGHAYRGIIRRNEEAFRENPEFLAKVGGERGGGRGDKFCISNPDLRRLVVEDAIGRVDSDTDSISMDPSDGGDWCECEECAEMGSVSDRVVILSNQVAEAINDLGFNEKKYVGIYAYASHSPPPSIDVHPKVIVSIATSFLRGGYTAEELVDKWGARASLLGIREYYYSYANLPGGGRGANISYLRRTIPWFHSHGARFNSANIHGSWGHAGFAYYLMARMMWDISVAERVEEVFDDFLNRAFEDAAEPMRDFYRILHRFTEEDSAALLSEDLLGRMYIALDEARNKTDNPDVLERLDDLILYTRHSELYHLTVNADGEERQRLYEDWVAHSYNMADRKMVHTPRMCGRHYAPGGVTPVASIEGRKQELQEKAEPYSRDQIDDFLTQGIANNPLLDFTPVSFSEELVPAAPLNLRTVSQRGQFGNAGRHRGTRNYYIWVEEPGEIRLQVRGGITYRDRGPVRLELFSPNDPLAEVIDSDPETAVPDQEWHEIVLNTPFDGLHELRVRDGGGRHTIRLPEGMPKTLRTGFRPHVGIARAYFYVPRGTSIVGGYADSGSGGIWDADGNKLLDFEEMGGSGHFSIDVPDGQDGRLWRVRTWRASGRLRLKTVPPYIALTAEELLLPREVVEADSRR